MPVRITPIDFTLARPHVTSTCPAQQWACPRPLSTSTVPRDRFVQVLFARSVNGRSWHGQPAGSRGTRHRWIDVPTASPWSGRKSFRGRRSVLYADRSDHILEGVQPHLRLRPLSGPVAWIISRCPGEASRRNPWTGLRLLATGRNPRMRRRSGWQFAPVPPDLRDRLCVHLEARRVPGNRADSSSGHSEIGNARSTQTPGHGQYLPRALPSFLLGAALLE